MSEIVVRPCGRNPHHAERENQPPGEFCPIISAVIRDSARIKSQPEGQAQETQSPGGQTEKGPRPTEESIVVEEKTNDGEGHQQHADSGLDQVGSQGSIPETIFLIDRKSESQPLIQDRGRGQGRNISPHALLPSVRPAFRQGSILPGGAPCGMEK